ncbi:MAG: outer membrane protein transport protein [Sideroxydans sp.]|nr:outer membrane protein transport protein [Sideroxydans sp.]
MKFKKSMVVVAVASALLAMSGGAMASGFALIEQSASGLGNAFAGGAASAEDASTVFFNPAGMSRLEGKQVVVAVHAITPSAKFTGTGGSGTNMGGDAGGTAFVPNAYFTMGLSDGLKFGLGLNAPFGLQTEYDAGWVGQHQALKSSIQTINVNPSLSYQVNDALSVGAGVNYQHISGELSQYGGSILGTSVVKGSDNAWGFNVGALYQLDAATRFGVSYRSTISYKLNGTITTSLPFANGSASLDVKLPDIMSFSVFHQMSDSYDVMADVSWTGWSSFKQVKVLDANGATISNTPENWKDTLRVSAGATHRYSDKMKVRAGVAYDQAPVPDAFRTARIPDNNRFWIALGGQYKSSDSSVIDFGYAHLFVNDSTISSSNPAPTLQGSYKNKVDILSVQFTQNF